MSTLAKDLGRSLVEGRLQHLRDEERKDANTLAHVLGPHSPIVVRMRQRADALCECAETIREEP